MKPEILVTRPFYPPALADLEREYVVHKLWTATDPESYLKEECTSVRAVVTTGIGGLGRSTIDLLPSLEIVACFGTPHGTVDLAATRDRGVVVTNTPDSIQETVADLALGLVVAVMRRICENDRFVRAGKWLTATPAMGREVRGKTCGIVGLGRIGRGVARRVEACGMAVCYCGPRPKQEAPFAYFPDLEDMARKADCLVVTCPETPATRGLVNARVLDALGPDAFLVNVARGAIVDQTALVSALRENRIAGAGLDVYWDEPRVPAELLALENVVLVPHIGSSTREVREGRRAKLLANLRAHFAGQSLPTPLSA
jgi:lactate dehydrogenase-like 2-hydroxyacid dehydrogenase